MTRFVLCAFFTGVMSCAGQLPFPFPQQQTLFSPMLDEPHVFVVKEITGNRPSFGIRIERQGGNTFTQSMTSSAETPESRFISKLIVGGRYRMPHCVIDFLGKDEAAKIVHLLPGKPLSELNGMRPFRAEVLDQGMGESFYSIVILEAGGRMHHLKGMMEDKQTRAVAAFLTRGRSFEFPAALEDALRTQQEREDRAKPKNDATAVLRRYLGEWSGALDANPKAKVNMQCHWRPDGSGIWREITFHDGEGALPPLPDIVIMEYNRAEDVYLAGSIEAGAPAPLQSTWNEKTRTFTTLLPMDDRGLKRVNEATFTREDRIDWKTTTRSQKNEILETSSGHYDRVRGPDTQEKEPPPPTRITDGAISMPLPPMAPLPELPKVTIAGLGSSPPFRAKVTSVAVKPDEVHIALTLPTGQKLDLKDSSPGIGQSATGKALAMLQPDTTYEFPHCILHPNAKPAEGPATPEMKELQPFMGEWKARVRDKKGDLQDSTSHIRYYWSADGSFVWREMVSMGFSHLEHLIHDTKSGRYTFAPALIKADTKKNSARWDATTRTYKTDWVLGSGPPGAVRAESVRTFKSDDLIEWTSRQFNADDTVVNESSGTYERIKP